MLERVVNPAGGVNTDDGGLPLSITHSRQIAPAVTAATVVGTTCDADGDVEETVFDANATSSGVDADIPEYTSRTRTSFANDVLSISTSVPASPDAIGEVHTLPADEVESTQPGPHGVHVSCPVAVFVVDVPL
jgi:hypothetical protein